MPGRRRQRAHGRQYRQKFLHNRVRSDSRAIMLREGLEILGDGRLVYQHRQRLDRAVEGRGQGLAGVQAGRASPFSSCER